MVIGVPAEPLAGVVASGCIVVNIVLSILRGCGKVGDLPFVGSSMWVASQGWVLFLWVTTDCDSEDFSERRQDRSSVRRTSCHCSFSFTPSGSRENIDNKVMTHRD